MARQVTLSNPMKYYPLRSFILRRVSRQRREQPMQRLHSRLVRDAVDALRPEVALEGSNDGCGGGVERSGDVDTVTIQSQQRLQRLDRLALFAGRQEASAAHRNRLDIMPDAGRVQPGPRKLL